MENEIQLTAKCPVQQATFTKGGTVTLTAQANHNLELVSFYYKAVADATAVSRVCKFQILDAPAGNILQDFFTSTVTAGQTKIFEGPSGPISGTAASADVYIPINGCIVPAGGVLTAIESAFVAGDTWTIQILYRDIPVGP